MGLGVLVEFMFRTNSQGRILEDLSVKKKKKKVILLRQGDRTCGQKELH